MPSKQDLLNRLEQAENARHRLLIGELEVSVSVGGYGATTFAQTDIKKLNAYIHQLKMEVSSVEGRPRRSPIFMKF